jgi:hypothetical protein
MVSPELLAGQGVGVEPPEMLRCIGSDALRVGVCCSVFGVCAHLLARKRVRRRPHRSAASVGRIGPSHLSIALLMHWRINAGQHRVNRVIVAASASGGTWASNELCRAMQSSDGPHDFA